MKIHIYFLIILFLLMIKPCLTAEITRRRCPSCALLQASYSCNTPELLRLLSHGVNPNSTCPYYTRTMRRMFAANESLSYMTGYETDPKDTPLLIAIKVGNLETVELLIKAGADLLVKDSNGRGALHLAKNSTLLAYIIKQIKWRFLALAQALHPRLGADSPAQYLTPFILQDIFKIIIDSQDRYGNTALHKAAENGNLALILLLLSAKANTNIPNMHGFTSLHFAAYRSDSEATSIAQALLNHGAQLEAETHDHKKAYYFADFNGDPEKTMLHFLQSYIPT
ncbi:MAG TPA: ankyrin repeat domain-containing protein [Candidatus Dependentiae bacterium]|nr:ankyrin repeat domain-containing protein [Candidatus Dependentiae bacterium]